LRTDILASWQAVHDLLIRQFQATADTPGLVNLTVYAYCTYRALQPKVEIIELVQKRFWRFVDQLECQLKVGGWSIAQVDQACGVAWLSERLSTDGLVTVPATLARLDQVLYAEAIRMCQQPDAASRQCFFQVLRYFHLRLPASSNALKYLQDLLSLQLALPLSDPRSLGLVNGLAAELLLLLSLYKSGMQHVALLARIKEGIAYLLKLRRPVDFLEIQYSVFPYRILFGSKETEFSAELSLQRGDIGQSLLLYNVHECLQDQEILKIAELVGLNTLLRTTTHTTEINTSQLARGSAGLTYLYSKLHQISGHAAYSSGYDFWLEQTYIFLRRELVSGFYQQQESDLAHGLVGIGLTLLSSLTELELGWDKLIL
jgi:hypothetical protein